MSETTKEAYQQLCEDSDHIGESIEGEICFTGGASWQAGCDLVRFRALERGAEDALATIRRLKNDASRWKSEAIARRDLQAASIPDPACDSDEWQIAYTRAKQAQDRNQGEPVTLAPTRTLTSDFPVPPMDAITKFPERDTAAARAAGKDITGRAGKGEEK